MKTIPLALATLLFAACSSGPEPAVAQGQPNCRAVDARTGSHLIRRNECDRSADTDAAQRSAAEMLESQRQLTTLPGTLR